jgi:alkylated DNA nucleotide flippase Atl1
MAGLTAREKIALAGPSEVHVLDDAKAARLKGRTMLIPSPGQMSQAIAAIPPGQTKTLLQLRHELAEAAGADVTCPAAASKCWRLVAEAAEEDLADGLASEVPWWRVTKDDKPHASLPGGADRHRSLLKAEGVVI